MVLYFRTLYRVEEPCERDYSRKRGCCVLCWSLTCVVIVHPSVPIASDSGVFRALSTFDPESSLPWTPTFLLVVLISRHPSPLSLVLLVVSSPLWHIPTISFYSSSSLTHGLYQKKTCIVMYLLGSIVEFSLSSISSLHVRMSVPSRNLFHRSSSIFRLFFFILSLLRSLTSFLLWGNH